jgi:hypothetical protein
VDISGAARFRTDWVAAYARRFPSASGVESFIARPGPPLTEVPPQV